MEDQTSTVTVFFVIVFLFGYILFLLRRSARSAISLFDFAMLSSVGAFPSLAVLFPETAAYFANMLGIKLPVNLLYGFLLFVVFIYQFRLTVRLNENRRMNIRVMQELGLLRYRLDERSKQTAP